MRIHNFAAGPAALPLPVLERAREELVDYRGTGMSVLEMSHRSPAYDEIHQGAMDAVRRVMAVPQGWSVLFLQGGASLQFSMVPMNLMQPRRRADYVLTGAWAKKAAAEARREGEVRIAATSEAEGFTRVPRPDELDLDPEADYLHLTTNNTIYGTQIRQLPDREASAAGDVPLVLDMSSDVLSWPVPVERVGLLYAGAQKNLGPAGVTLVIVRDDLLERAPESLATMLQYRTHAKADSLYNTPPTFAIYLLGLCLAWVEEQGGVAAMEAASRRKADTLYAAIDAGALYRGTAEPASRSRMNITFRLTDEALEERFLAEAAEARLAANAPPMVQLKGHRSVGGVRASLYNAVPQQAVDDLVAFMADFERRHG